jgi:hypothetical protein
MVHSGDTPNVEKITAEVRPVHERALQAVLNHNAKEVESHFSEAFSTAGGDFQFESREALVRAISSGEYKYKSIKSEIKHVKAPNSSIAIISDRRSVRATIKGKEFSADFNNKAVYALEQNGWRVVLWAVENC